MIDPVAFMKNGTEIHLFISTKTYVIKTIKLTLTNKGHHSQAKMKLNI